MTSSLPSRRYAQALRRLGGDDDACAFYDVHVTADALHEQLALHDLCGGLVAAEPRLAEDVVFGAAACLHVERRFAEHLLAAWQDGRPSLRRPVEHGLRRHRRSPATRHEAARDRGAESAAAPCRPQ
jgi:hypothetical protein